MDFTKDELEIIAVVLSILADGKSRLMISDSRQNFYRAYHASHVGVEDFMRIAKKAAFYLKEGVK